MINNKPDLLIVDASSIAPSSSALDELTELILITKNWHISLPFDCI